MSDAPGLARARSCVRWGVCLLLEVFTGENQHWTTLSFSLKLFALKEVAAGLVTCVGLCLPKLHNVTLGFSFFGCFFYF